MHVALHPGTSFCYQWGVWVAASWMQQLCNGPGLILSLAYSSKAAVNICLILLVKTCFVATLSYTAYLIPVEFGKFIGM